MISPVSIIHSIGAVGLFPSRAFVPAFIAAVVLRYGDKIPFLADNPLLQQVQATWLTHDITLVVLGILAVAEIWAAHDPDIRRIMDQLDQYVKPVMALLTTFGVLTAADQELMRAIHNAGIGDGILAVTVGAAVYLLVQLRLELLEWLDDIDDDNSLGLHTLFGWIEDLWASLGMLLLFLFPLLMAVLIAVVVFILKRIQRKLQKREEAQKVTCPECGAANYPSANQCFTCAHEMENPKAVGFLGQAKLEQSAGHDHHFKLLEKKRCPVCAAHLQSRSIRQNCKACDFQIFQDPKEVRAYDSRIHGRIWQVLPVTFALSLIPVLGIIPAVIYYRIVWVAPYRRYIRTGRIMWTRFLIGILSLLLLAFQWIPLIGGASLPLIAMINHAFYRKAFLTQFPVPT